MKRYPPGKSFVTEGIPENEALALVAGVEQLSEHPIGLAIVAGAKARNLTPRTARNIRQNLVFAFGYNALGIPIAAGVLYPALGLLLSPIFAGAAMALSSVPWSPTRCGLTVFSCEFLEQQSKQSFETNTPAMQRKHHPSPLVLVLCGRSNGCPE